MSAGCAFWGGERPEPLTITELRADKSAPQRTHNTTIAWTVNSRGGNGEILYQFKTEKKGREFLEQEGPIPVWEWRPRETGTYRIKVVARDASGMTAESGWSEEYKIISPLEQALVAVLPIDNISGVKAPLKKITKAIIESLAPGNFFLLDHETLADFLKKHRMRYTGGLSSEMGKALREELGVDAVFITSLESYQEERPPKISLIARVVLCGDWPEIIWMDSVGLTGYDKSGLLGLARIHDADLLLEKSVQQLLGSLRNYLTGKQQSFPYTLDQSSIQEIPVRGLDGPLGWLTGKKNRYLPHITYRSPAFDRNQRYTIAVIPFLNKYARKNAGYVVSLHFVKQLLRYENINVIEPGLVREALLKYRLIMEAGPSLAVSDIISHDEALGTDFILSGKVFDYQGLRGTSKVDFSIQVIDSKKRETVWTSRSYATGDDGVVFFDFGKVRSAHGLTTKMSEAVVSILQGDYRK